METLTIILQVFRFLSMAVGLLICFFGYQIREFILNFSAGVKGALLGYLLVFLLVLALSEVVTLSLTIGLVGGVVGGFVGVKFSSVERKMGLFSHGAFVGGLVSFLFIIFGNMEPVGALAIFLLLALVGGLLALKVEEAYYKFLFAFLGAGMIVRSLFSYLVREPVLDFFNAFQLGEFLDRLGNLIVVLFIGWMVLGVLGVLVQYRSKILQKLVGFLSEILQKLGIFLKGIIKR